MSNSLPPEKFNELKAKLEVIQNEKVKEALEAEKTYHKALYSTLAEIYNLVKELLDRGAEQKFFEQLEVKKPNKKGQMVKVKWSRVAMRNPFHPYVSLAFAGEDTKKLESSISKYATVMGYAYNRYENAPVLDLEAWLSSKTFEDWYLIATGNDPDEEDELPFPAYFKGQSRESFDDYLMNIAKGNAQKKTLLASVPMAAPIKKGKAGGFAAPGEFGTALFRVGPSNELEIIQVSQVGDKQVFDDLKRLVSRTDVEMAILSDKHPYTLFKAIEVVDATSASDADIVIEFIGGTASPATKKGGTPTTTPPNTVVRAYSSDVAFVSGEATIFSGFNLMKVAEKTRIGDLRDDFDEDTEEPTVKIEWESLGSIKGVYVLPREAAKLFLTIFRKGVEYHFEMVDDPLHEHHGCLQLVAEEKDFEPASGLVITLKPFSNADNKKRYNNPVVDGLLVDGVINPDIAIAYIEAERDLEEFLVEKRKGQKGYKTQPMALRESSGTILGNTQEPDWPGYRELELIKCSTATLDPNLYLKHTDLIRIARWIKTHELSVKCQTTSFQGGQNGLLITDANYVADGWDDEDLFPCEIRVFIPLLTNSTGTKYAGQV